MNVRVDPDLCTGCGLCVETCPEVFEMLDSGVARAIIEEVPENLQPNVKEAADDCPPAAIIVSD
jgi:ferredoxin